MRPYLAIVKDSFREALASRTLWILMILITLTLLALAPFSYYEVLTAGLHRGDITDADDFIQQLRSSAQETSASPAQHIWSLLDEKTQEKLQKLERPRRDAEPPERFAYQQTIRELQDQLDSLMRREDFFHAESWRGVNFRAEARRLTTTEPSKLSREEIGRRNRLALEAAFPELIRISRPKSTQFTYLGWNVSWPLPFGATQMQEQLFPWILFVLDWVVGPVGIFVAVLVTASMIPQMFDAGSLSLMLSKPISRSLLYIFKFLGGCAFIVIAATVLFGGLWLILGVRLGIWNHKMLLYIPIYLFLFSIYYVVSAFSGLVWRSTVIAVAVSIAFWAACYGVGSAEWAMRSLLLEPQRITYLVATNDTILTLDEFRVPHVWDQESRTWQEVFLTEQQQRIRNQFPVPLPEFVGKAYDSSQDRFLGIQRDFGGGRKLWVGQGSDGWRRLGGVDAPSDVVGLFQEPSGGTVIVNQSGVQRVVGDPAAPKKPARLFGLEKLLPQTQLFEDVSDNLPSFAEPRAASIDARSGLLAVYSRGEVYTLALNENDRYGIQRQSRLQKDEDEPALVAVGANVLFVAFKNGDVFEMEVDTLKVRRVHRLEHSSPPRFAHASLNGRFIAFVFHNGAFWLWDGDLNKFTKPRIAGQGSISAIAFPSDDEVLVADRGTRVRRYQLGSWDLQQQYAPEMELLEMVYRYAVLPLYTVFPKPSELYRTSQFLITGKETQPLENDEDDLSQPQLKLYPWRPVWSSAVFVLLMLVVGCIYFERQEF
jgi:ABC-type transport system involved in multi-copper enzyme maturation permease subunit